MNNNSRLQESDLIFSSAASALKDALGELRKSNLSIKNRLRSIKQDADFVTAVAASYNLPLVANERCGSWYISSRSPYKSAYFKSTDGHFGQWTFSLRRLNLQILDFLHEHHGCIIVDSTRRGKSMPDALSKTIPIWSTVLNRLLFPDNVDSCNLQTPRDVISPSEHSQIEQRLDDLVQAARGLDLDVDNLRRKLHQKPIHIDWIRPNDVLQLDGQASDGCNLIILCTASSRDSQNEASSEYVQGAADDHESWAHGLNADTFWRNSEMLLSASEDDLPDIIRSLVTLSDQHKSPRLPSTIRPTDNVWIGDTSALSQDQLLFDVLVVCAPEMPPLQRQTQNGRVIHLACATGKLGSRKLRTELCKLDTLRGSLKHETRILVVCETGKDISVGASLALLCKFFDHHGHVSNEGQIAINKTVIKHRLSWIMVSLPDVSPSRATLQSVNAYLMG